MAEPASVDALHLLSLARKQAGDTDAAEKLMQKALQCDPRRPDIHGNLANLYASMGRLPEAEAEYRQALRVEPRFRPARLGLARALLELGLADGACDEAMMLVNADANDAEAWNVMGSARRLQGRPADAEQAFRRALSIAPTYVAARHNLGALLASQSRAEEALAELDAAAASGLDGPEIAHNRAAACMAMGRLDDAESLLRSALAKLPASVPLHMLLARIRYMRGDPKFADHMHSALQTKPQDAALRAGLAQLLRGAGDVDSAARVLASGIETARPDPRLLAEMSVLMQDRGEFEEALRFAQRAVSAQPGDPSLNDLVIRSLLSLGRGAEAMPLIESARRDRPLDQSYIALEATAARIIGDSRYERLCNYERFVQRFELPVPRGWRSIEDFHEELIPVLNERHKFVAPPLDQSLRSGTQTPRGLLNDPHPVIRAFLEAVREPIDEYRQQIGSEAGHPLTMRNHGDARLTGCWSVRLHRDGFHLNHVHSEGWISSAYYVDVPPEVRDTALKSGWIKFGEPGFPVPGAGPEKTVQPEPGVLLLFPSYMWHGTTPIHGDQPRLTIAFDVAPGAE